ncbi:uncharacterized protein LOC109817407 [Cajanus cajan]|uniref:Uncharacterized protein n=1 Tax=Cajanus cajan TaxID=3821 RepID=A0A151RMR2_CAJCA|nr:uncharacterized protein LOC109817407 [Cajanus cajan]KYP43816.1 hypothetical protein KK1_034737 [Cajanus cajan]
MNRRARPTIPHHFHKYLKPGALARIRDSRISARSHRLNAHKIPLHRAPSTPPAADQPQVTATAADVGYPFFAPRIYGPRCPQHKKLMAAKSVFFVPVSPAADSPDLVIDALGADLLLAN